MKKILFVKWCWFLLIIILGLGSLLYFYIGASRIEVRAPTDIGSKVEEYPSLTHTLELYKVHDSECTVRNVAEIDGILLNQTNIKAELFLVRHGASKGSCGITIGKSSANLGSIISYRMHASLAVYDMNTPFGTITSLTAKHKLSSVGSGTIGPCDELLSVKKLFNRSLRMYQKEIVYIEGTDEPVVYPGMSLKTFIDNNKGEYLVLIVSFE
jgi:hypothetical protein